MMTATLDDRTPAARAHAGRRILLVEDQADIATALAEHLRIEGHQVAIADTGEAGLASVLEAQPDLLILDLMLPGIPGEAVLRQARSAGVSCPVLILSARGEETVKVNGFRLGADDYVTKPFGLLELLARVDSLLRRTHAEARVPVRGSRIAHRHLVFDLAAHRVTRNGTDVDLRPKERELLFALLERAGQTIPRESLLRDVWGYAPDVESRTVDWHVAGLRRKLGDDEGGDALIRTVRNVGYLLHLDP
jgi:DNA-binding response OmpR family regulator